MFEVTKISSKDRILQRTRGQTLEGSEMLEQLEEVERTCVDCVDESISQIMQESFKAVLPEREQSGVIEVTSSQDRKLQRYSGAGLCRGRPKYPSGADF